MTTVETTAAAAHAEESRTEYPHIVRRPGMVGGRPRIAGTRIPVWQIANLWNMGETIPELLEAFPHVTPAAVHSALAYYFDHQVDVDAEIDENRPENVLAALRRDPRLMEEKPGVFRGKRLEEQDPR
jgi:uncharacterized protein (DUF433 family)